MDQAWSKRLEGVPGDRRPPDCVEGKVGHEMVAETNPEDDHASKEFARLNLGGSKQLVLIYDRSKCRTITIVAG
jgi:hypothetical protein